MQASNLPARKHFLLQRQAAPGHPSGSRRVGSDHPGRRMAFGNGDQPTDALRVEPIVRGDELTVLCVSGDRPKRSVVAVDYSDMLRAASDVKLRIALGVVSGDCQRIVGTAVVDDGVVPVVYVWANTLSMQVRKYFAPLKTGVTMLTFGDCGWGEELIISGIIRPAQGGRTSRHRPIERRRARDRCPGRGHEGRTSLVMSRSSSAQLSSPASRSMALGSPVRFGAGFSGCVALGCITWRRCSG